MLQKLVWLVHMICAFFIILLVLLQHGKGADMGSSFGAGASQTIFGSQGSGSFLTRITTIFALIFAITSISLSFFINKNSDYPKISEIYHNHQQDQSTLFQKLKKENQPNNHLSNSHENKNSQANNKKNNNQNKKNKKNTTNNNNTTNNDGNISKDIPD
jgi:preprotein translocase subunit SecG